MKDHIKKVPFLLVIAIFGFIGFFALQGKIPANNPTTIALAGHLNETAPLQADWTEANAAKQDYVLHKPSLFSGIYTDLTGKPTLFSGAYSALSGAPTLGTASTHATADFQAAFGAGTIGQYLRGDLTWQTLPVATVKLYAASITQSGTSAPSATAMENDFGATTFTWARSSAGVYTVTASSAVFTSNKTEVFLSPINNPLASIKATVTSTTVVTIQTALTAILSLVLTTPNTDGLLTGTGIQIAVYN